MLPVLVVVLVISVILPPRLAILKGSGVASVAEGRMTKMAAKATKRVMIERNIFVWSLSCRVDRGCLD